MSQELELWTAPSEALDGVGTPGARPPIWLEHSIWPNPCDPRLVILNEPASAGARSYRLLRHRLLSRGDPRIIAITSAHPGDGKTTCATNLALAIAEDTLTRVLLVDANLLHPALGRVFGFTPSESLVENIARFSDIGTRYPVVSIAGTRLHVAALTDAPLESGRLDRTLFGVALSDLRDEYDYVVIDAASVFESGDVDVVAESSNGVIVAARAGSSRKGDIRRAIAQLAPALVLGTVLIDA